MNCPKNLTVRAQYLHCEGFGYQPPEEKDGHFVICRCQSLTEEQIYRVKQMSGASTLNSANFLGKTFIKIHWTEYALISAVFTAMLECNIPFCTTTKPEIAFNSRQYKSFTQENFEKQLIAQLSPVTAENVYNSFMYSANLFNLWNWQTLEGREFCQKLRSMKFMGPGTLDDSDNFYRSEYFKGYDPITLQDK